MPSVDWLGLIPAWRSRGKNHVVPKQLPHARCKNPSMPVTATVGLLKGGIVSRRRQFGPRAGLLPALREGDGRLLNEEEGGDVRGVLFPPVGTRRVLAGAIHRSPVTRAAFVLSPDFNTRGGSRHADGARVFARRRDSLCWRSIARLGLAMVWQRLQRPRFFLSIADPAATSAGYTSTTFLGVLTSAFAKQSLIAPDA